MSWLLICTATVGCRCLRWTHAAHSITSHAMDSSSHIQDLLLISSSTSHLPLRVSFPARANLLKLYDLLLLCRSDRTLLADKAILVGDQMHRLRPFIPDIGPLPRGRNQMPLDPPPSLANETQGEQMAKPTNLQHNQRKQQTHELPHWGKSKPARQLLHSC